MQTVVYKFWHHLTRMISIRNAAGTESGDRVQRGAFWAQV